MNSANSNSSRASVPIIPMIIFGVLILLGGFLLSRATPLLFPPEASTQSQEVDQLFQILLMIGGVVFLLIEGLLLISVLRYRVGPEDKADGPSIHGNATLELVWTAIPSVIVLVLVILSYQVWLDERTVQEGENLVNGKEVPIAVTAQRFAWAFAYNTPEKDPQGNPLVIKVGTLYTYVGQKLHLNMNSLDVIHSFWVPAFRMKQDVLPGRTTDIRFTIAAPSGVGDSDYPLTYPIRCAELCGGGHGGMTAEVVIYKTEQDYVAKFYNVEIDKILHPPADPVAYGQQILAAKKYPCYNCHTLSALGWTGNQAPNLDGVGDRAPNRVPGEDAKAYIEESIYNPQAFLVPGFGPIMPHFEGTDPSLITYMPEKDWLGIVAFLCTQTESGTPACTLSSDEMKQFAPSAEATQEATQAPTAEATKSP